MAIRNPTLCDYCQQKPKFGNHPYCGKTCATQAAASASSLCNYCHSKPKFGNYDYCSKNCATQAKKQGGAVGANGSSSIAQAQVQSQVAPSPQTMSRGFGAAPVKLGSSSRKPQRQTGPPPVSQPQQPQVQVPYVPNLLQQPPFQLSQVPAQLAAAAFASNPFIQAVAQGPKYVKAAAATLVNPASVVNPAQSDDETDADPEPERQECLIPGCGLPVHTDLNGAKISDYCSMRHREEAVVSGIAPACIMCLTLPQGDTDYFCSRACREEAMSKEHDFQGNKLGIHVSQ